MLADARVLESRLPTTLVDLSKMTVDQTAVYHLYAHTRDDYFTQEKEILARDGVVDPSQILQKCAS